MEQGQEYVHQFSYTQEQVNQFAQVTGDNNPLHMDEAYAAKTAFRRPIMHGFLGGSIFSKVLGTLFPGEGTIYLKQSLEFVHPMFVNTIYEAIFTVKEILPNSVGVIETQVKDPATGIVTITGEALVRNKKIRRIRTLTQE